MSSNPNHHIAIHGHFYQPPRENPWLGVIEEQESAYPYHDWNERIAAESYTALTCSPVTNADNAATDLFNCYAHISFNFGPTLNQWLDKNASGTLARITLADEIAQQSYHDHGSAIAQVYNHVIMPLADSRDRHTQIIWGLKEFEHRFKRKAESIWLSETAINMDTVRCLIDHGIKYVILSPLQAAYVREFGEEKWSGVPHGSIETRQPYRLFEVDGGGRTHFDRYIDVLFYDKDMSTKVSFEHLLNDAQRLEWFMRQRLDDSATLPQLVLVATDGEIYGHHEKHGNRALAYFLNRMLSDRGMDITNLGLYLHDNPPTWEVRLWEGVDDKGSSWSCSHGVGRWERDCGCGDGPSHWTQKWRGPVRQAFNQLRDSVRGIFRREMGELVFDAIEARNDYVNVLMEPTEEKRGEYVTRHAQRKLNKWDESKLWTLLEMDRHAMLMYTSCGWFFCELSGLEPVQNMRYAMRAAELANQFSGSDHVAVLQKSLERAESNLPEQGNGADIFRKHVLSTRYGFEEVAAVHGLCRLLDLAEPQYLTECCLSDESVRDNQPLRLLTGVANCLDRMTMEEKSLNFVAAIGPQLAGVFFCETLYSSRELGKLDNDTVRKLIREKGVLLERLPFTDRRRIFQKVYTDELARTREDYSEAYERSRDLLRCLCTNRLPLPKHLRITGEQALTLRLHQLICEIASEGSVSEGITHKAEIILNEASQCGLYIDKADSARIMSFSLADKLEEVMSSPSLDSTREAVNMLKFSNRMGFEFENRDVLLDRFWRVLHLPPRPAPKTRTLIDAMRELGTLLGFDEQLVISLTRKLFSTAI